VSTGGDKPGDPPAAAAPPAEKKELSPEDKAKLAKEQADALAALEADEKAPAPAPVRAADAPVAATKATEAKPAEPAKTAEPPKQQPPKQEEPAEDPNKIPSAPPWWKTLRADPPATIRLVLGIALIALLMGLWWIVTHGDPVDRIISPSKLPSPGEILGAFGALMKRDISDSIMDTLQRVLLGVSLAAIVGVGIGVLAGANRGAGSALAPLVIFLRSVPMGAMIPLTLLLFGDEEKQKTMFIFLAIVPFVFSDTVKAISIVPERYVETAQTLGASNRQILRKVLVPLALPDIITSLRFQFGLALGYVMLAEAIATSSGLGVMLNTNQRQGNIEQNYALLFIIALLAFMLDLLIRFFQRGIFQWRRDL
jgi:NitT/TauT family transport system permease protein